ncbi:MAG: outer membrane lipoprotein chaperone LolA [bacterium]|nr:outer membrane lipoprotein chaperone LolA [bacterium]
MNPIARILLLLLVVFSPILASAELSVFKCIKPISKEVGQKDLLLVQVKYGEVQSINADFQQHSYLDALDTWELSSGKLTFSKPGKMKWAYSDPEPQEFISDGKTMWFYQPLDKQVMIDTIDMAFKGNLPISFLLGIGNLSTDFNLKSTCESSEGIIFDLVPKKSDQDLGGIRLLVDSKTYLPNGAEVLDAAKNKNSFVFSNLESNNAVSEDIFSPKFPSGTDKIDNRIRKSS